MYKFVKRYYDMGIYTQDNVKTFVIANKLTAEEYEQITGEAYAK
ncbi:XkdX family protein [Desulforamulus ruminis]|uniref:Phage uncharacterized protein, XkdX family n=1 Tax=Desulforamulus ruminis (strain ATCC 23193 / DSM 2154 / NCIMB 8452 / DL) TaxID=696281 RepID=F6DPM5_DESRL|nr:XkdX family protein [Desulforamulus ruminis]AEG59602.1 phage uncharacterized protein, XkdX family [Desulforamulus ruminis DSM 2154]